MNFDTIYKILSEKIKLWFHTLIQMLPNLLLSVVVLVLGLYIARWLKSIFSKLVARFIQSKTLGKLLISIIHLFLIAIVIFTVLSILRLDKAVTSLLAGAGILGLALAFAFQDIASNFISGIFISFRRPIHLGDIIKIKEFMGKVEEINLRDTVIKTFQGEMVIIPNKDIFQNPIQNFSLFGKRRFDLKIGVSYDDDLQKVKDVTLQALKGMEGISKNEEITLIFTEFGDSTINFSVRFWLDSTDQFNYVNTGSNAMILLQKVYRENSITLPTPIRTIEFSDAEGNSIAKILEVLKSKS